ncbi:MAG: Crp/Fnr family transcriptional regulator [Pseudomonadota bacterium]
MTGELAPESMPAPYHVESVRPHEQIFARGLPAEYVYKLLRGEVVLTCDRRRTMLPIALVRPGAWFGVVTDRQWQAAHYGYSGEAGNVEGGASLGVMPRESFYRVIAERPDLAVDVVREQARVSQALFVALRAVQSGDPAQRVAHALLLRGERGDCFRYAPAMHKYSYPERIAVVFPAPPRELAKWTGLRREQARDAILTLSEHGLMEPRTAKLTTIYPLEITAWLEEQVASQESSN